jgi:putative hydrolase
VEVNEKWNCPAPRSLRFAAAAGARIVASTDAHVSTEVGVYDRVATLLGEAGSS